MARRVIRLAIVLACVVIALVAFTLWLHARVTAGRTVTP